MAAASDSAVKSETDAKAVEEVKKGDAAVAEDKVEDVKKVEEAEVKKD